MADMTAVWSRPPVERVARLAELGPIGNVLAENNGESRRLCLLERYPGWILKEYRVPTSPEGAQRLSRLIQVPGQMNTADKAIVDAQTSWPTTRVVDDELRTVGVLIPQAPSKFYTKLNGRAESRPLEVDLLALTEDRQSVIKVPPQSLADRISVCASIAAVGSLLERHGLVYLDWSYANVFWSLQDHTAYVIDLDGCSFGPRPQIQSNTFDDPLVPRGYNAGNESDRYRLALLTTRCLTGLRPDPADARSGLDRLRINGHEIALTAQQLIWTLDAQTTAERSSIAELSSAFEEANNPGKKQTRPGSSRYEVGGVTGWKPIAPRGNGRPSAVPKPHPSPNAQTSTTTPQYSRPYTTRHATPPSHASNPPSYSPSFRPTVFPPSRPWLTGGKIAGFAFLAIVIIILIIVLQ